MRIALCLFWLTVVAGALALPQTTTPPATKTSKPKTITKKAPVLVTPKKTVPANKTGTGSTTVHKTGTTTKTGKAVAKSTKSGKKTAPVRQRGQTAPTPERYRDIQAALAAKGYLNGEPSGVWDSDSMDAMRRFQTDQKLTPTGKISASSLIGLGLGPKPPDSSPIIPPGTPPTDPAGAPPQR